MFSQFFHMKENPFGDTPNVRFFFRSETHFSALAHVLKSISTGKGLSLVSGEVGTGKTLLCRVAMKCLDEQACKTAMILQPIFDDRDLLMQIADEFGAPKLNGVASTLKTELDRLQKFFLDSAKEGKHCVLFIDEAHKLSFEALETIRLLTNLETDQKKLVHVALFAQPELDRKLSAHQARQIKQRLTLSPTLTAFSVKETEAYLKHRVGVAGGENFIRFAPSAIRLLQKTTKGIPRLINFYAEMSLVLAENRQERLITSKIVREVAAESASRGPGLSFLSFLTGWRR